MFVENADFLLVHAGINPEKGLVGTTREEFLTIRTWPPNETTVGPRWHDHHTPGNGPLVFGHDAPGGLVVKRGDDGTPYLVGLDSGCVYGFQLSAYVLDDRRILQVPSRQPSIIRDTDDRRENE